MKHVRYIFVDEKTGDVTMRGQVPDASMLPESAPSGQRMIVVGDGAVPRQSFRIDRRKIRAGVVEVPTLAGRTLGARPMPPDLVVAAARVEALAKVDRDYAQRIAGVGGPLAALHAEKRRQAEAGGGPLVADEADRLAILANAAAQDEAVAAIERERRAIKAALRAATTADEIKAALAVHDGALQ